MKIALDNLPTDPGLLQKLVRGMACVLQDSEIEIGRLRQIIRDFQRARFGRRSEQMSPAQFELGLEDLEADLARLSIRQRSSVASMTGTTTAECGQRRPLPEHLPRECVIIQTEVEACPPVRRPAARCWHDGQRDAGLDAGLAPGLADPASQTCLSGLWNPASGRRARASRGWLPGDPRSRRPCADQPVLRPSAPVSPKWNPGSTWGKRFTLDPRGMGWCRLLVA
ncbi:hypothetical protein AA103196_2863 [Ameyamaea chiangmaiensis NBRC 103196]|nr:hypothetical protein AA103196_2863 [Ameyamaea chiangmaiensis NBRC 103196]